MYMMLSVPFTRRREKREIELLFFGSRELAVGSWVRVKRK
jgi:hypothetical protein